MNDDKPTPTSPISAAEDVGGATVITSSSPSPIPPPTNPRGLPADSEGPPPPWFMAFRADWEDWKEKRADEKKIEKEWRGSVTGSLKIVQSEIEVMKDDIVALQKRDGDHDKAIEQANARADEATSRAAQLALESKGDREAFLSALANMTHTVNDATSQISQLTTSDNDLKKMIAEATTKASQETMVGLLGKNPKLIAAITAILIALSTVLTQRFLVPPAAPNQGVLPGSTPTVHVVPSGDTPH